MAGGHSFILSLPPSAPKNERGGGGRSSFVQRNKDSTNDGNNDSSCGLQEEVTGDRHATISTVEALVALAAAITVGYKSNNQTTMVVNEPRRENFVLENQSAH